MSDENSDMQKSSHSQSQVLMAHGFSVLGKWTKSSLEAVLKFLRQAFEQETDHTHVNHRCTTDRSPLIIATMPTVVEEPCQRAFDLPGVLYDLKALHRVCDDLQSNVVGVL